LSLGSKVAEAIGTGRMGGRLWLYSNYHCNLACTYCLTESSPSSPSRELGRARMVAMAKQASRLGFTGIGITGGEPFLLPYMVPAIGEISDLLPVTVLTNGTLFNRRRLEELASLAGRDVRVQISLDRPDPAVNDAMRGPGNFAKVLEAVPRLLGRGIRVRIATTVEDQGEEEACRLRDLVRSLGVPPEDHVVRRIVRRGRADVEELGVDAPIDRMSPELTITVDGAFWSPFAPTFRNAQLQKDLLVSRTTEPLSAPVRTLLDFLGTAPQAEESEGFV
jgi:MoaA/NifB/PqqE/SkfB family radical SAM enzyme